MSPQGATDRSRPSGDPAQEALAATAALAQPILARRVARKFDLGLRVRGDETTFLPRRRSSGAVEDAEDLLGDCWASLLQAIDREGSGWEPDNVPAYLNTLVDHCFADWLRRRYPARHRLKQRLRAVLDGTIKDLGFAVWEAAGSQLICGFADWSDRPPSRGGRRRRWVSEPEQSLTQATGGEDPASLSLPYLLSRVLNWIGGPIPLEELVTGLAAGLGEDRPREELGTPEELEAAVAEGQDPTTGLEVSEEVGRIAGELADLPGGQRTAILLALELDEMLALLGAVGPEAVCRILEVAPEDLPALCAELPLPDLRIAANLGLTRQQVINMRKAGRRRLVRRLQPGRESA